MLYNQSITDSFVLRKNLELDVGLPNSFHHQRIGKIRFYCFLLADSAVDWKVV